MDLRKFEVQTEAGLSNVEAEDVVTHDGFVVFINADEENGTTVTVAMFNQAKTYSVMEVKNND